MPMFSAATIKTKHNKTVTHVFAKGEWISKTWDTQNNKELLGLKREGNSGICYHSDDP